MIDFDDVTFRYRPEHPPVLEHVDLHIDEGELCLIVGQTGSGKSTLLRSINGLVPHFTGGQLSGRVSVAGRDTRDHPPRELADVVGMVLVDPSVEHQDRRFAALFGEGAAGLGPLQARAAQCLAAAQAQALGGPA